MTQLQLTKLTAIAFAAPRYQHRIDQQLHAMYHVRRSKAQWRLSHFVTVWPFKWQWIVYCLQISRWDRRTLPPEPRYNPYTRFPRNVRLSHRRIATFGASRLFWLLRLKQLHSTTPLGSSRRNIAMTFGTEKQEWWGYPTVKCWRYVYSFWQNSRTWQTDRQTDGQTPHDGIGRGCV